MSVFACEHGGSTFDGTCKTKQREASGKVMDDPAVKVKKKGHEYKEMQELKAEE